MKLYGRYLSPFVRRVGTSLALLDMPFEHVALSVVDHKDAIRKVNPMGRVPALELNDGTVLVDSTAILDTLDQMAGPQAALTPPSGEARRNVLQLVAFAVGACDKIVSAYYERSRRPKEFLYEEWAVQCEGQARAALARIDAAAATAGTGYLVGGCMTQADVSAVIAYDFARTVLPDQVAPQGSLPHLEDLAARLNATEAFRATHPKAT